LRRNGRRKERKLKMVFFQKPDGIKELKENLSIFIRNFGDLLLDLNEILHQWK
jgi:hypothetical protein